VGDYSTPSDVVIEASPLISFLKVKRFDILEALYPSLVCTEQVIHEVILFHQREQLLALIEDSRLREVSLSNLEIIAEFAHLTESSPLGPGEVSSLLYASDTGSKLIITDKKGIREAQRRGVSCISTQDVLVSAIHQGIVSLEEADTLITTWKAMNEYPVSVTTFTSLFGCK